MNYPSTIIVGQQELEINTDFETALACIACINDDELSDIERAYGVLALLYKSEPEDEAEALRLAVKYLQQGREPEDTQSRAGAADMDYEYDMHYIRSSFRSDYGIDLMTTPDMHWWQFGELLQGLTDQCILNRVRDLRNYDLSSVKDPQTRAKIIMAQRDVALPGRSDPEDQEVLDEFYAQLRPQKPEE